MEINKLTVNNSIGQISSINSVENSVPKTAEVYNDHQAVQKDIVVNKAKLKSAVDFANKVLFKNNTHLKFQIHDKTKEVMVKIINDESGEVVKEIPPEKMLDMVAKLWEIAGIIVDERR